MGESVASAIPPRDSMRRELAGIAYAFFELFRFFGWA